MKTSFSLKRIAASTALIVAGGLLAASPALADIKPTDGLLPTIGLTHTGYQYGFVSLNAIVNGNNEALDAGLLTFDTRAGTSGLASGTFASYCLEPLDQLSDSFNSKNSFTLTPLAQPVANQLASLYAQYGSSVTDQSTSAAFQTAVWEITHETETSATFNVLSGNFQVASNPATIGVLTTANDWLSTVSNQGSPLYLAQKYANDSKQDLLVITAVPEPETYAMLLAGLGLMVTIARRRKA